MRSPRPCSLSNCGVTTPMTDASLLQAQESLLALSSSGRNPSSGAAACSGRAAQAARISPMISAREHPGR